MTRPCLITNLVEPFCTPNPTRFKYQQNAITPFPYMPAGERWARYSHV
nr:MAG TPA: hypothetical protein [Bacteriophage sp.]